jgi:MFS family permease
LRKNPLHAQYAADGLMIYTANNIIAYSNNLYAVRLGAGDFELSLVQFLPQFLTLLVLIPGGFLVDSALNKNKAVILSLAAAGAMYFGCSFAPFLSSGGIYLFLAFLSLATAAMAMFNISWQSFFPEAVVSEKRNDILALRTQVGVFVAMLVPLLAGAALALIEAPGYKTITHQIFYGLVLLLLSANAFHTRKFNAVQPAAPKRITKHEVKTAARRLARNKPFLCFAGAAMFFYMTWQMDWTLYFIGQSQYLRLNEFQLGLVTVGGTAAQFLTIRFWSKKNERHGVVLPMTFGILGLALCPISMISAVSMPASAGPYAFLLFNTLSNLAQATVLINVYLCMLEVTDGRYRSFTFSVFSCLTCLSNAVMPVAGVALYRALGGDLNGLRYTFWIVFILRILAAGIWLLRWKSLKDKPLAAVE